MVEYIVLWSFSHAYTLAREQPVSDYNYLCCWLYLFKGTDTSMSFPNLKNSIKTILPQMSHDYFTARNLLLKNFNKWHFYFYSDISEYVFSVLQATILLNSQNHLMNSTTVC